MGLDRHKPVRQQHAELKGEVFPVRRGYGHGGLHELRPVGLELLVHRRKKLARRRQRYGFHKHGGADLLGVEHVVGGVHRDDAD